MKNDTWNVYRTRFLVKAKQLTHPLSFVDPLGREQRGKKGDYLVEWFDGMLRIAPRGIFEDVYVPMQPADSQLETCLRRRPASRPQMIA